MCRDSNLLTSNENERFDIRQLTAKSVPLYIMKNFVMIAP